MRPPAYFPCLPVSSPREPARDYGTLTQSSETFQFGSRVHKPATIPSEMRRLGARFRPREPWRPVGGEMFFLTAPFIELVGVWLLAAQGFNLVTQLSNDNAVRIEDAVPQSP